MTSKNQKSLDFARSKIAEAVTANYELQRIVDAFNAEAPVAGHGPTTVDELLLFSHGDKDYHGTRLPTLVYVCQTIDLTGINTSIKNNRERSHVRRRLFDVTNVRVDRDALVDIHPHVEGVYSCFYKSYERKEQRSEYFEVVRYHVGPFNKKAGLISGKYTTLRMVQDNEAPSDFFMVLAPKRAEIKAVDQCNVFSVFHYDDREDKTIIYSLVRPVMTYLNRTFLYGITVREDRSIHNIIAYKVLWVPEKKGTEDKTIVGTLLRNDEFDDISINLLNDVFDYDGQIGKNLYLEIGLDGTRTMAKLIAKGIEEREDFPIIRLRTG